MAAAITKFCEKHGLTSSQENELKSIFIDLLLDRCTVQTNNMKIEEDIPKPMEIEKPKQTIPIPAPVPASIGKKPVVSSKKFATVKTEEYATENGLCLDDFDIDGKISKTDVIQLIKKRTKNSEASSSGTKKQKVNVDKQPCHALTKTGDNCKTRAKSEKPEGATFHYCPKHFDNWKVFEETSDTEVESDEEEEPVCKEIVQEVAKMVVSKAVDEFENEDSDVEQKSEVDEDEGDEVTEEDLFN